MRTHSANLLYQLYQLYQTQRLQSFFGDKVGKSDVVNFINFISAPIWVFGIVAINTCRYAMKAGG